MPSAIKPTVHWSSWGETYTTAHETKHISYNTLVRPTLEYCSAVWDPHTRRNIDRLEQINTKAARSITNNYTHTPGITTHLKQQIIMDPLHIRRQTQRITLTYKITNNYIDIDPHTYLHSTNNQRTRNTHNHTYQTYYANTDSYKHSYFPRTIRDWHRLPQSILTSNTIDSFTKQIHILSPQHPNTNTHTWFLSLLCTPGSPSPPPTSSVYACYAPRGCPTHHNTETETETTLYYVVVCVTTYTRVASFYSRQDATEYDWNLRNKRNNISANSCKTIHWTPEE